MHTLPDRPCRPGGVVLVGINPAPVSVAQGHYYRGTQGRRLWKRLARVGLLHDSTEGREDDTFVAAGHGLTDLVKRPTASAAKFRPEELTAGVKALRRKISRWKPGLVLFAYRPPAEYLLGSAQVRPGRCDPPPPQLPGGAVVLLRTRRPHGGGPQLDHQHVPAARGRSSALSHAAAGQPAEHAPEPAGSLAARPMEAQPAGRVTVLFM